MNHKQKKELAEYFAAPEPLKKRQFVRRYGHNSVSMFHMAAVQCRYISKVTWICSLAVFALGIWFHLVSRTLYMGAVYAMIPFIAVLTLSESMRSCRYGMEELEAAARFSLKSVVLMRMVILGAGNLILFASLAVTGGQDFLAEIIFLLVPYLLTAAGGLLVSRSIHGREGEYLCFALSVLVALLEYAAVTMYRFIFEMQYIGYWLLAFFVCLYLWVRENCRMMAALGTA